MPNNNAPCDVDFTFVMKIIALNKKKYRPWAWVVKGIPVHYGPWGENWRRNICGSRVTLGHMQLRHGICIPACLLSEVGQAACSYACYKFEIWNTLFQTCYKFEIWNSNLFSIQTFFVRMCKREQRKSQPCCKIVALGSLRGCRGVCLWFAGFYGYDGICVWARARHMNFSCPRSPSGISIRARHI